MHPLSYQDLSPSVDESVDDISITLPTPVLKDGSYYLGPLDSAPFAADGA